MTAKRSPFLAMALAIVVLSTSGSPAAQIYTDGHPAGSISAISGRATLNGAEAREQEVLNSTDLLQTDADGRLRLALDEGSVLTLGTNSQMRITYHDGHNQQTVIELNYGNLRSVVNHITRSEGRFEIRTPAAVASVLGTDIEVIALFGRTTVNCYTGSCSVISLVQAGTVSLEAGQSVTITPTGFAGLPQPIAQGGVTSAAGSSGAGSTAASTGAAGGAAPVGIAASGGLGTAAGVAAAAGTAAAGAAAAIVTTRKPVSPTSPN